MHGLTAIKESAEKIINPGEIDYSVASLIIIAVAVVVKYVFGKHVKKVGKDLNSQSLIASGQDAFMDAVLSFTTLIAAIINFIWHLSLEGYLGVIIGLFIIKAAFEMLKETANTLIGERADKEFTDKIKEKVCSYNEVQGAYDLSLHNYGPSKIIGTVHIQVRDDMTAEEIHRLTKQMTIDIYKEFGIIMTIGIYAANDNEEFADIKKEITRIISEYQEVKQIHGFYVDKINKSVYFDLIIDFEARSHEEIRDEIISKLKEKFKEYSFIIILDADISD